jgi:LPXTG-motif cell wall-anchored protein
MKFSRLPTLIIGASIAAVTLSPNVAFAGGAAPLCSAGGLFSVITTDQYIIDHPDTWDFEVTSMRLIPASGPTVPLSYVVTYDGPNGTEKYTTVNRIAPGQMIEVKFDLLDLVPFPDGTFYRGAFTTDYFTTDACPGLPPTTVTTTPPTTTPPTTVPPTAAPTTAPAPTTVAGPNTTVRPVVTLVPTLPTVAAPTTVPSVTLPQTGTDLQTGLVLAAVGLILSGAALLSRSKKPVA